MMNKLLIPTILVATVMVAGIFAFMPVEQASTVHESEEFQTIVTESAGGGVRVTETINDETGLSGYLTFDRIDGAGVFSIDTLMLCDFEADNNWRGQFFYQTETSLTTGTGAKLLNSMERDVTTVISGNPGDGVCIDILQQTTVGGLIDFFTGNTGLHGETIQLLGDENNNVIVFMRDVNGNVSGSGEGTATIVAYISGIATGDITITETEPAE